ncbi:hypothetical protein Mpsy_0996 [Methanolobus psychrophilus R15]|nr:hypothetical protein Mpsy_0996 [Methanolobus psychrophilus R15]
MPIKIPHCKDDFVEVELLKHVDLRLKRSRKHYIIKEELFKKQQQTIKTLKIFK